MERELAFGPLW
jgi:hypothetical protein